MVVVYFLGFVFDGCWFVVIVVWFVRMACWLFAFSLVFCWLLVLWCLLWFWLNVLGFAFGLVGGVGVFSICALFDLGGSFSLWGLLVWLWFWCLECLVLFVLLFGCVLCFVVDYWLIWLVVFVISWCNVFNSVVAIK